MLPVPFPALLARELQAGMNGSVRLGLGELPLQGTSRLEGWHCAKEGALLGTRSSAIPALALGIGGNQSPHPLPCRARQPGGHPACEEQAQTRPEPPKWLQQSWCHPCCPYLSPRCAPRHQLCTKSHLCYALAFLGGEVSSRRFLGEWDSGRGAHLLCADNLILLAEICLETGEALAVPKLPERGTVGSLCRQPADVWRGRPWERRDPRWPWHLHLFFSCY